jgi:hypothetical protein
MKCFRMEYREFAFVFVPRTELRVVFFSAEWFKTEFQVFASIFVPRNRIPSCFLFRRMVQNGILRVSFFFCSTVQNSEHFFSSAERFGTKFRKFYVTRASPNSAGTNQLFRPVFLGIIFWSEQPWSVIPR